MKTRHGFVSNSSSTSFVLAIDPAGEPDIVMSMLQLYVAYDGDATLTEISAHDALVDLDYMIQDWGPSFDEYKKNKQVRILQLGEQGWTFMRLGANRNTFSATYNHDIHFQKVLDYLEKQQFIEYICGDSD